MKFIELLAFLWQFSPAAILFGFAVMMLLLGAGLWWLKPRARRADGRKRALGLGMIFLSFGLGYSVLIPPFQMADEPNHFLGYLHVSGQAERESELKGLLKRNHFEEIRFRPQVSFKPEWREEPSAKEWTYRTDAVEMDSRAPLNGLLWRGVATLAQSHLLTTQLLALRGVAALFASLCVSLAYGLVTAPWERHPARFVAAMGLLAVPGFAYFSAQISNYSLFVGLGILASSLALDAAFVRRPPPLLGASLAAAGVGLLLSGKAGFLYFGFLMFLMVIGGFFLQSCGRICRNYLRIIGYWMAFSAVFVSGGLIFAEPMQLLLVEGLVPRLPFAWQPPLRDFLLGSLGNLTVFFLIPFGFCLVEMARATLPESPEFKTFKTLSVWSARLTALPFVLWALTIFLPFPAGIRFHLHDAENPLWAPDRVNYMRNAIIAFASSMGLGTPDPFMMRTFWAGFGWLDTIPNGLVLAGLAWPIWAGWAVLWIGAFVQGRWTFTSRLLVWNVFHLAYIAVLAWGARMSLVNLHGRYLIGFFASYVLVSAWGLAGIPTLGRWILRAMRLHSWNQHRAALFSRRILAGLSRRSVAIFLICFALGTHGYCFAFIIKRYFGGL